MCLTDATSAIDLRAALAGWTRIVVSPPNSGMPVINASVQKSARTSTFNCIAREWT